MHLRQLTIPLLTLLPLLAAAGGKQTPERHAAATAAVAGTAGEEPAAADTVIVVDKVQVTAIKQGMVLRSQPVAATIVGSRAIERERIGALKHLSQQVPNFFAPDYGSRMTSSIYVRGLGARIDQPVMGLNIDNVPVLNKDNYDTELADAERIEVLRGPQSTLYGRNTMGGVINVYTLSPLSYEGVRLSAEYGSGDSYKFRASSYYKLTPDLGMAVTGYYTHTGGFFENLATGDKCDWERLGGGRWKTQWRNRTGLRIDNTLSFSVLEQGGYPYAYVGDDIIGDDGRPVVRRGEIRYNDPCSYRRTALSDGLTIRYDAGSFTVASITCYQYSDDEMILDQDFLPLSYFTLRQARTEHSVTEDLVFRSRGDKAYRWLLGAFGFYRHGTMNAPVHFKQTGIEELILKYANENDQSYRYSWGLKDGTGGDELFLGSDFRMPSAGGALYHESNYTLGRWRFTAGLRFDFEHARLRYRNYTDTWYTKTRIKDDAVYELQLEIDDRSTLKQTFTELLPKFSVMYSFDETRNLYLTIAKGYKSGGFNTQIFSDVLQQKMMNRMGIGEVYDVQRGVAYKPEYSWNYEVGFKSSWFNNRVNFNTSLFYIDLSDQQVTQVLPTANTVIRNAGKSRSMGFEVEASALITEGLLFEGSFGYTDAKYRRYSDKVSGMDYAGNRTPLAPEYTYNLALQYSLPLLESFDFFHKEDSLTWITRAELQGVGKFYWNDANTLKQDPYELVNLRTGLETDNYPITFWAKNVFDKKYNCVAFAFSGSSALAQVGAPRSFGVTFRADF